MSETKKKWSLVFKIFIVILSATGLIMNFMLAPITKMMLYFTILSNLMVFIFYLISVILYLSGKLKKNTTYYIFKGMVTMCITLTLVVYQAVLSSNNSFYDGHFLECSMVHLFTPASVILDYVIFGEKGNLKKHLPFVWSIFPVVYTLFCEIYGALGGTFADGAKVPYFYLDTTKYGLNGVILNCLIIYVLFVGYGYTICCLDELVGKKIKKKNGDINE